MKATVLIVHNYYQIPGGEDTVVANEKKMLEDNGHKVILYSRNNNELKEMSLLKKIFLPLSTIYNFRTSREIKRIIRNENIDIVHVHNTLNLISPAVYYAGLKMQKPVIQTIHNFRLLCPGATFYRDGHICEDCVSKGLMCAVRHKCYRNSFLQTLLCAVSTKVHRITGVYKKINYICLTEFNKEKMQMLKGVRGEKIFVKPNFVTSSGDYVIEENRKNQFVFAGRIDKLKGIDILLNVWANIGVDAPKLVICGTGPLEDWCKKFISEKCVNAEMVGFVSNEKVKEIIGSSKALILPTQWYEGFPMSIVEAYSTGTPVICTDLGNCGCVVEENVTGYKFRNGEELKLIVNNFEDFGEKVINVFNNQYTESENYKLLESIYNKVLGKEI